ncbi:MAG: hypothetical protein K2Y12_10045 [Chitinophagaceae bacterium]|nr:hypothetical protein [Chitinophagaceae bacterium]
MPQARVSQNKYYQRIQEQLAILLKPASENWQAKREACHTIAGIFAETDVYNLYTEKETEQAGGIWLNHGYAVSTWSAAMCLLELKRTMVFLAGLVEAIQEQLKQTKEKPIHILDAGCGPFALLSTLSCFYFKPEEVQFHRLDIFEDNITASQKLADALGIADFFSSDHCTDATNFQWPFPYPLHLVVSETMLNGLRKEPQVAISLNLSKQLHPTGMLIPEEVSLYLAIHQQTTVNSALTDAEFLTEIRNMEIACLMQLNKQTSLSKENQITLPTFSLPAHYQPDKHAVAVHTRIRVFGKHILDYNDCSLTLPLFLSTPTKPRIPKGAKLDFHYSISHSPGVQYSLHTA